MFYLDATVDHPASKINEQLNSFQLRQQWEESLKKGKLIKEENLGNGIKIIDYYGYIKMPMIFSDRDIVVRKKIWEYYNNEKDCCLNEHQLRFHLNNYRMHKHEFLLNFHPL